MILRQATQRLALPANRNRPSALLRRTQPACSTLRLSHARSCSSHGQATGTAKPAPKPPADHRKLGIQQELFTTSVYSPGSPILLPNGARIFNRLVDFLRRQYVRYGFEEVITPTIYKKSLWAKSGHLENYADDMFTVTSTLPSRADSAAEAGEEDEYGLKPMNCPGHCLIFASQRRSYRDLPIRYADFSPLHRNEISGALSGMTRVRRFHQDDGHIFCRPMQIEEEIKKTLEFVKIVYSTFKLGPYRLALSTRPAAHFIGSEEDWASAEGALRRALDASGQEWTVNEGDGAFYGPKIDIVLRDSDGKEHQTATIQLDFQLPKRFELEYTAPAPEFERRGEVTTDPEELAKYGPVQPVLIHRAVLGSVERLMALLVEHYDGAYPFWLNPRQVMILTVNDSQPVLGLAAATRDTLLGRDGAADTPLSNPTLFAVDIDDTARSLQLKLREAKGKGYGVIVTVGPKDVAQGTITADLGRLDPTRTGTGENRKKQTPMKAEELLDILKTEASAYRYTPPTAPPSYETAAREHGNTLPIRQPSGRGPPGGGPGHMRRGSVPPAPLELPVLKYMKTHRVILASASPRRRAMFAQLGIPNIEVLPSTKPENLSKTELGPYEYVASTAQQKALDVYQLAVEKAGEAALAGAAAKPEGYEAVGAGAQNSRNPAKEPDLVIAADTIIVSREGRILEKPPSEAAHIRMLQHLRDTRVHRCLTAVCAVAPKADASHPGYEMRTHVEETKVFFARESDGLPDDVIESYVKTREGVDKAGGYAVQGIGGMVLVERVEGSVDNVIGLPMRKTLQLCERVLFKQGRESDDEEDDEDEY
ncbi:hypothetical protein Micbo1qcDRAFT_147702 [Microdochium bolleyi]|uniref:threonine--tRNA ligase n=1 Tax=Microdochium bolleyi TaxID=196109 RepID=A0A136J305_9PEZI|nr:hypothetical protein Micbo1qcDRAFT_147702 [Microdochium bolleyi]